MLDGNSQQLHRVTSRPFMRVEQADNLEALVEHLSSWTLTWKGGLQERRRIEGVWREALFRLNPGIDLENLTPGTKVSVLTYFETVKLLQKTDD